jgi:hypothetical protein
MKTIKDAALFTKEKIIRDIPDRFENGNEELADGMRGLASLLHLVADKVIAEAEADGELAATEKLTNAFQATLPDLTLPYIMLYSIGLCGKFSGVLNEGIQINGSGLFDTFKNNRGKNHNRYLSFLTDIGFEFSEDVTAKPFKLNKIDVLEARYPDSPLTLLGLKALAESTVYVEKQKINAFPSVFMRGDYHALALPKKFQFDIRDFGDEFCIGLHENMLANNCKCETAFKMNEYIFTYTSKTSKKIIASSRFGFERNCVKINSRLIDTDAALLADAPEGIKKAVGNGWVCAKTHEPNACNAKCVPARFTLDGKEHLKCRHLNFYLPTDTDENKAFIKAWIKKELEA